MTNKSFCCTWFSDAHVFACKSSPLIPSSHHSTHHLITPPITSSHSTHHLITLHPSSHHSTHHLITPCSAQNLPAIQQHNNSSPVIQSLTSAVCEGVVCEGVTMFMCSYQVTTGHYIVARELSACSYIV